MGDGTVAAHEQSMNTHNPKETPMTTTLLRPPVRNWACPSCSTQDRTERAEPHTQMHACPALGDLNVPLVQVSNLSDKVDARHVLLDREDYVGDSGADRLMACRTDHGDGSNDQTVFAPVAEARVGDIRTSARFGAGPLPARGVAGARMRHAFHDERLAKMARIAAGYDVGMAWSTSKIFGYAVLQMAANAIKPSTDSYKGALYGSASMTPDNTVATAVLTEYNGSASQWVTANESTGTGYTAGGAAVTPISSAQTTNVWALSSSGSPQWTTATLTAYGILVYDTTVSNEGFCFNYFGGVQSITGGTFTVVWNAAGIATITC
jgi:hypothetical protein